jgi:S-formylglutathione hydrolase FrmB
VGLSEGGTCSVDLALRHPHLFDTFADYSGDLDPNLGPELNTIRVLYQGHADQWIRHDPLHLMATHRYDGMNAWFAAGDGDSKRFPARLLAAAARRSGMHVELHITSGNHNFYFWKGAFAASYPWLVQSLEPGREV